MRLLSEPIFNAASQVTSNSAAVDATSMTATTLQAVFSDGAAAGTLKLQGSNDAIPSNWNDVASSSVTVAAGATSTTPIIQVCYSWIRAVWTSTGGAGTFTVRIKSVGY